MQEIQARRAEEDAVEARRKTEEARRAAESTVASAAQKKAFDDLKIEQERAERIAHLRRAVARFSNSPCELERHARAAQFQHDGLTGRAELVPGLDGLVGVAREPLLEHRHARRREQPFRLVF